MQRVEELQKAGAASTQDVEKARLEVSRQREELTKLDQQLDQAKQGARPEEIRALEAKVEEAQAGLDRIGNQENLVVKAEVPEGNLWAVQVGQQARITGDGLRGKEYQGQILRIAPVAEENLLKPNTLVIPADALVEKEGDSNTETVWVVEGGKTRHRTVRLGLKTDQLVEVVSGLKSGEEVILAPPPDLTDSSPVRVKGRK